MYVSASFGALFDEASSPLLFMVLSAQPRDVLDVTGGWIRQATVGRSYGVVLYNAPSHSQPSNLGQAQPSFRLFGRD